MTATEDKYLLALQALLPPGEAWTREEEAELTALLQGFAAEAARIELRGLDLLEEFDPRTTTELIDDWERVLLTGSECGSPTSLADRRARVHQRLLGHGDPNLTFWQEQIETLAFVFGSIVTYRPMSAGFAAGDSVIGGFWAQGWTAIVTGRTDELNALLLCTLNSLTPVHTTAVVSFQPYETWAQQVPGGAPFAGDFFVARDLKTGTAETFAGFLIAGQSGEIQTSPDGEDPWTQRTADSSYTGRFYGGATWGAIATTHALLVGETGELQRSTNAGVTWATEAPAGAFSGIFRACAGYSFENIAVGDGGEIQYTAGAWAQHTAAGAYAGSFRAAAVGIADFGSGASTSRFVVAGTSGEIQVHDLVVFGLDSWQVATADEGFSGTWFGCTYANGYFWLVGASGEIQQSPDGFAWRRITNAYTQDLLSVADDRSDSFSFGVPDVAGALGGIIIGDEDQDLHRRARVGPEMLLTTLIPPSGSLNIWSVAVGGDSAVAVTQGAGILHAPREGT